MAPCSTPGIGLGVFVKREQNNGGGQERKEAVVETWESDADGDDGNVAVAEAKVEEEVVAAVEKAVAVKKKKPVKRGDVVCVYGGEPFHSETLTPLSMGCSFIKTRRPSNKEQLIDIGRDIRIGDAQGARHSLSLRTLTTGGGIGRYVNCSCDANAILACVDTGVEDRVPPTWITDESVFVMKGQKVATAPMAVNERCRVVVLATKSMEEGDEVVVGPYSRNLDFVCRCRVCQEDMFPVGCNLMTPTVLLALGSDQVEFAGIRNACWEAWDKVSFSEIINPKKQGTPGVAAEALEAQRLWASLLNEHFNLFQENLPARYKNKICKTHGRRSMFMIGLMWQKAFNARQRCVDRMVFELLTLTKGVEETASVGSAKALLQTVVDRKSLRSFMEKHGVTKEAACTAVKGAITTFVRNVLSGWAAEVKEMEDYVKTAFEQVFGG